jgi:hypothetical protein
MKTQSFLKPRGPKPGMRKPTATAGESRPNKIVKMALHKRGEQGYRNFYVMLDEAAMKAAGLKFGDTCDLRMSEDGSTCEVVKVTTGPRVSIRKMHGFGELRTRVPVAGEFSVAEAQAKIAGGHVVVTVPEQARKLVKRFHH